MIPTTLGAIAAVTGGALVDSAGVFVADAAVPGAAAAAAIGALLVDGPVVTDSRQCGPGSLYIARIGEHADGHDFVNAAHRSGAVAALTSRPVTGLPHVVVPDVQGAFGALARSVLQAASGLQVVGITGSSGKTSTKDLLAQVLAAHGPTVAPVGSFNGEIGVPLTVCRITAQTRFLVVEMGARGLGHIAYLTRIAPPRIGIVLNVGQAHVGEFGGLENVALAKSELVRALPSDGVAVLNADDPVVSAMSTLTSARVVLVGEHPQAAVRAERVVLDAEGRAGFLIVTPVGRAEVTLRLHGRHHVGNALAVVAAALECGLPLARIAEALSAATPVSRWRMEVTHRPDGVTVVNDAYNANPDSMGAALRAVAAMGAPPKAARRRTWAVLGEMLELGDQARTEHERVGALAVTAQVARLVTVGERAASIADGAVSAGMPPAHAFRASDADAAYALLAEELRPGDVVLVKSSNGAGLRWLGDRVAESVPESEVGS